MPTVADYQNINFDDHIRGELQIQENPFMREENPLIKEGVVPLYGKDGSIISAVAYKRLYGTEIEKYKTQDGKAVDMTKYSTKKPTINESKGKLVAVYIIGGVILMYLVLKSK